MYVDVKVEVWQRIFLNEEDGITPEMVIGHLEVNKQDIYSLWDMDDLDCACENIDETEYHLSPDENDGFATIEMYNDEGQILWANGKTHSLNGRL